MTSRSISRARRATWGPALTLGALALLASAAPCRAGLILFTLDDSRAGLSIGDGTVAYDAGPPGSATGHLVVTIPQVDFVPADPSEPVVPIGGVSPSSDPSFVLDLVVDKTTGGLAPGGANTLNLAGSLDINGTSYSGTLLSGVITAFGAADPTDSNWAFNGLFTITGGMLTDAGVYQVGETGGFSPVVEQQASGILGDFAQSFSGSSVKGAVGIATPEPPAAVLAVLGLAALAGRGWLQRRRARG